MSVISAIREVNDQNLAEVMAAERGILIVTKSTCGACAIYQAQIEERLERGELDGLPIGKLVLDRGGSANFKRANPWLAGVAHLPYTVLYQRGQRVDEFAASKASYLIERVEDAFGL